MNNNFKNFFNNKKILVAGATGFLGSNLVKQLKLTGANIRGTIHKKNPVINHSIDYLTADLTNPADCLKACNDIDIVFMCAANSSGAAVIDQYPLTHLTPNIVMNAYMLEAAYKSNVKKFVFISSNTVYPVTDYPVSESDTNYTFFSKYHIVGWMKLFSEEMCKMYLKNINNPMQTTIIRPGNLYGPYDKYTKKESKVIAALIRRFAEKENPMEVWGDGNDIKDFIFIDDFIEGLLNVTMSDINGPINIASGKQSTIKDVINHLIDISESKGLKISYDLSKPSMIPVRLMSNNLAHKKFDFNCKFDLLAGLKATYEWYLNFYNNSTPEDFV